MFNDAEMTIEKISDDAINICANEMLDTDFGKLYYPSAAVFTKILQEGNQKDFVFIAKQNEEIAGFIWFSMDTMFGKFPYLNLIFVFETYRNQGVGKKLLQHFEKTVFDCYKNPKLKVFLIVKNKNENAIAFYKKNGYISVGTIDGLFRASVNEILMMKYMKYEQSMEVSV
ncbi:MAG: GNAT family N-acetyltransferase [Fusobacterium necrophorum]|nr:GNAT family N-acetyltransferase [Fusobacterium necrophorum]